MLRSSIRSPRNETTGEYSRYFIAKFPWSYKLALTSTINAELRHFVSTRVDFARISAWINFEVVSDEFVELLDEFLGCESVCVVAVCVCV